MTQKNKKTVGEPKPLAVIALIFGIISAVCMFNPLLSFPSGIVSIILGIIVLIKKKPGKKQAVIGIICSVVGILIPVLYITLFVVFGEVLGDLLPIFFGRYYTFTE